MNALYFDISKDKIKGKARIMSSKKTALLHRQRKKIFDSIQSGNASRDSSLKQRKYRFANNKENMGADFRPTSAPIDGNSDFESLIFFLVLIF